MNKILLFAVSICLFHTAFAQLTPFEQSATKNTTATYPQVISFYQQLDLKYDQLKMVACGFTDIGKPLHLVILSENKVFDPLLIRKQNKRILLVNNGIHPGEPEGIDASMMLARDLLEKNKLPDDVVICIIPVYNIDGSLNRGVSRVNQNGPDSYGFRGNAKNLDLNRDFIKTDSKNSYSFQEIFNIWQPEGFMDNHTSNGADYQYIMTLIETQKDKLNPVLSSFMTKVMEPELYKRMKKSGFEMIPYVEHDGETPDSGITAFLETPRFSTGYTSLHNTIGFIAETHMLKPFDKRVYATYELMKHVIELTQQHANEIGRMKAEADAGVKSQHVFPLNWELDKSKFDSIIFKGYEGKHKTSRLSGLNRLYYDRNAPFEKKIRLYNTCQPIVSVEKPLAYIIPQAWQKVIDLLKLNRVEMKRLSADAEPDADMYYIADYKTGSRPYEGHYIHTNVKLNTVKQKVKFYEGDYVVYVNQAQNRYIVETLEPQGTDSFFAWNFFDSILGQKEYFSAYVFEDDAAKILEQNPGLRKRLEEEKVKNPEMAKSAEAQLSWVYKNSRYYEKTHLRYPIGRILTNIKLDLK